MIGRATMRRALFAALASVSLIAGLIAGLPVGAQAEEIPRHVCDYDWREGTWQLKRLIKCAARRWDSPGVPMKAVEVARCESHLNPEAYNSDGYAGLYQQSTRYWADRADRWGQPDRSAFNARANIIVSIRMARALDSWSAWGGCA